MAGYSGKPLKDKLGYRIDTVAAVIGAPMDYAALLDIPAAPPALSVDNPFPPGLCFLHLFTTRRAMLEAVLSKARTSIAKDGMVWASWPKKASKLPSEITEDTVREIALPMGFVDIKVCAIDETWSGLKLVIRKDLR
ncbi:MAG: hypothetical protein ACRCSU_05170 [Paracoccaceae bacterium]